MSGRVMRCCFLLVSVFAVVFPVSSIPEQGLVEYELFIPSTQQSGCDNVTYVQRTMFKESYFRVKLKPTCAKKDATFSVYLGVFIIDSFGIGCKKSIVNFCKLPFDDTTLNNARDYATSREMKIPCNKPESTYLTCSDCYWHMQGNQTDEGNSSKPIPDNAAVVAYRDGIYVLFISLKNTDEADGAGDVTVTAVVESRGSYGYLSAIDWPQLPFFRIMFVIYFFYTFVWLVLCCCHRADLLRIQYWIGGVIFIGLIEKAIFLGEYETLNKTGQSVYGAIIFGELVSSAKKMLSRMLVIIVSVGFGIVKPRLGTTLHKVLAVGLVYFIASAIEGCLRAVKERVNLDRMDFIAEIVLAVVDSCICWWIFSSLVQTMRTLRLRRNVVKLSLYRHFTNTLIFAVLASVGFMIWSIIEYKYANCIKDWKELWVNEAFWHLLFAIILLVIMVLWRPSANNQRYAYSPLTDAADDEAEEPMINEAFDGIKMRNTKSQENNSSKAESQMDEDLKWIEDNIPTSIVDSALPGLLDSEEEVVTTAYEMNKMQ